MEEMHFTENRIADYKYLSDFCKWIQNEVSEMM